MKKIQELFDEMIERKPIEVLADYLIEKLKLGGVNLTQREARKIAQQLMSQRSEAINLPWRYRVLGKNAEIEFADADQQGVLGRLEEFQDHLPVLIETLSSDLSETILKKLKSSWEIEAKRVDKERSAFRKRISARWGVPLQKLKMLLAIVREFGGDSNSRLRDGGFEDAQYLIDVVTRLHARGCQLLDEIICLLEAGFADGAMARWRTLHEIAVTSLFISKHGEEAAEQYSLHEGIEAKRAADDYQRCRSRLGYPALTDSEVEKIEEEFASLVERFGQAYTGQYGWAAKYLSAKPKQKISFAQIEREAEIEHLRAHYRMASHNIHANPKGIFYKLGILGDSEMLLAGASIFGFADPGHGAAISILQLSSVLSNIKPNLDAIVVMKIVLRLVDDIGDDFLEVSNGLRDMRST